MSLDVYLTNEVEVYDANITHNLGEMARAAGIYYQLWRPEDVNVRTAGELIEPLRQGLFLLKTQSDVFKNYNARNKGWGEYKDLVVFVEDYLQACIENPEAAICVSR